MRFNPFLTRVVFLTALFCLLVVPVMAQEEGEPLGPGEGAPIIESNFGGDIATINPILVNDGSSQDVVNHLFPNFISADPDTGLPSPDAPRSIAQSWEFNEDRTVMTITLDDNWVWSDGTPVTSADVKYAYDAIVSGDVDTPLTSYLSAIETLEAPDPQTVVITFSEVNCNAEIDASNIPVVPAHAYQEAYPTFADMNADSEFNLNPPATAGPFKFENFRPGEQVTTLADQNYPDSPAGHVVPEGWVYKNVQDQLVAVEQFLAGELTWVQLPEDREADMRERAANGEFTLYETPSTGWLTMLFNQANPDNPQPGVDEEGNRIEQEPHPIFGDVRVRQAVSHALNHEDLNAGAFSGTGVPVGGEMLPQSWAYNENIEPYAFDPELSMQLLDEAGFVDDDNDPETPRVANEDALYAEPGTVLEFDLTSFTGNLSIDAATVLMQDQLKQVGFQVNLDIIEFTPMLDKLVGQTYDALLVFWGVTNVNPGEMYDQLGLEADIPGAGYNTGSWYNEEFEQVMKEAAVLPGCDQAERKALYDRAQEIIHAEVPRIPVNTSVVPITITSRLENFDPKPNASFWNQPAWQIQP